MTGRTTLQIDSALIADAMELSGAKSKSETINLALKEFVRHRQRELLRAELGTFDFQLNPDDLQRLRRGD